MVPSNCFGIAILAAGESRRFGSPKQLADVGDNLSMVRRAALEALKVERAGVAVVVGAHLQAVCDTIEDLSVKIIHNEKWTSGISASIQASVCWAKENELRGLLLLCCDQIHITAQELQHLADRAETAGESGEARIACAFYDAAPGIPAYFPSTVFDKLMNLKGDKGAKNLLIEHCHGLIAVDMEQAAIDVDTAEDLQRAKQLTSVHSPHPLFLRP